MQLQFQRQSGTTDYSGHLQSGSKALTPYRARTNNTASQLGLAAGYALNAGNWPVLPAAWQVVPLFQVSQFDWQRNLAQYSESYRHGSVAAGALLQWQARSGTVLELLGLRGRAHDANVSVPTFAFAAQQPAGAYWQWHIGISQSLADVGAANALAGWRLAARYSASRYSHAASVPVNGLQAPPSQYQPSAWSLGLQKQF